MDIANFAGAVSQLSLGKLFIIVKSKICDQPTILYISFHILR